MIKSDLFRRTIAIVLLWWSYPSAKWLSTDTLVSLHGKLVERRYRDANDNLESEYVLLLSSGINVLKDEFGKNAVNIQEIQLVSCRKLSAADGKISANVNCFRGKLFRPMTAHHHTKICMLIEDTCKGGSSAE